ncbi:unnamed protein product [Leptidea sinapis]|uniref:Spermatogenesis-associated protein 6 N-terminal domain-containing protein n=1 Tax=Leptidea sinapis TaxID=189913 RepID=A0A5E4R265_9NEOP|nr:unnamed protein product [Leptidea sinapis]
MKKEEVPMLPDIMNSQNAESYRNNYRNRYSKEDETIYCELVQWCDDCTSSECVILAQYLGSLNDVLFPPNMCSNDGVDLLMRRSKNFPGILSPKIEIATKVRIDEVWSVSCNNMKSGQKQNKCTCRPPDNEPRQGQVCHSAQYHRASLEKDEEPLEVEENMQKNLLESCFIEPEPLYNRYTEKRRYTNKTSTCVCEICKRYYEIFHSNGNC